MKAKQMINGNVEDNLPAPIEKSDINKESIDKDVLFYIFEGKDVCGAYMDLKQAEKIYMNKANNKYEIIATFNGIDCVVDENTDKDFILKRFQKIKDYELSI